MGSRIKAAAKSDEDITSRDLACGIQEGELSRAKEFTPQEYFHREKERMAMVVEILEASTKDRLHHYKERMAMTMELLECAQRIPLRGVCAREICANDLDSNKSIKIKEKK